LKVQLITHTPNPEKIVAGAAKLCYSSSDIDNLMDGLDADKVEKFIKTITDIGHESPLEHCTFTFGIEGVSRALLAQLTRHRIASYSVKSQRYVDESKLEVVVPPAIAEDTEAKAMFDETTEYLRQKYIALRDVLKERYIAEGVDAKTAHKKAIEDARFVLPNACTTAIIMTMNIRSLLNLFSLRCCNRAQWEIREMANQMLEICKEVAPNLFAKAGANCIRGKCTEGSMSCGNPITSR